MSKTPLLPETDCHRPFALRQDETISRGQFAAQVLAVARQLPAEGRTLNMCSDRYWFTVALFASMARGLITVLPNSSAPEHLAAVAAEQPGLLVLTDQADNPVDSLPGLRVDQIQTEPADNGAATPQIPYDRTVVCVYTSGSTGTPAPHYKTFGRLQLAIQGGASRLWEATGGPCSVIGTVPIRHMYGLEFSVLLPTVGSGILSTRIPFFPADIASSLEEMPLPRLLVITPYHLRKLIESGVKLPEVSAVLSATAPLSVELAMQTEALLGCPVLEIYGSTETGQLALRQPCRGTTWHNLPGITLEQHDGETWAHSKLYQTPQMLNDQIEIIDSSSFRLIDRKANMINVAGKRSSLAFLNQALTRLPGVKDGIFCVPLHDDQAEAGRVAAFVVAPELKRETILAGLRAHLDPVFLPRPLVFVESLPRDGNGKIPARVLAALMAQHMGHKGRA